MVYGGGSGLTWLEDGPIKNSEEKNSGAAPLFWKVAPEFFVCIEDTG